MAPADGGGGGEQPHKAHRQHKSGAKARKKKGKGKGDAGDDAGGQWKNPKVRCRFEQARDWCPWSDLLGATWVRKPCCSNQTTFPFFQAFAFQSAAKAKRLQARSAEIEQRRLHVPIMDRSIGEPPPFVVVVQGPPQVCSAICTDDY